MNEALDVVVPRPFNEVRAELRVALSEYQEVSRVQYETHAAMKEADQRYRNSAARVATLRNEMWNAVKVEEGIEESDGWI